MLCFAVIAATIACNSNNNNSTVTAQMPASEIANGEALFKANCASCHKPVEPYVGPALKGVANRWPSKALLYEFVRNSQEVISRNDYAKKLYMEYKESPMLPFPQLTDADIDAILKYCDTYKP